jgi:hypothetical protein
MNSIVNCENVQGCACEIVKKMHRG